MKVNLVTRSFITTKAKVKGREDVMTFPNLYKNQVTPILEMQGLEVEEISEELIRYGMTETEFLKHSAPIIKEIKESESAEKTTKKTNKNN